MTDPLMLISAVAGLLLFMTLFLQFFVLKKVNTLSESNAMPNKSRSN